MSLLFSCNYVFSQETPKEEKKVVIVKKIIETGSEEESVKEATGEEAEKMIQKLIEDGIISEEDLSPSGEHKVRMIKKSDSMIKMHTEGDHKNKNQNLEVEKSVDADGNMTSIYTLTIEEDGKTKVLKWDGEGEPPAEMKSVLEDVEVRTIVTDGNGVNENIFIMKDGKEMKVDGEKMIIMEFDEDGASDKNVWISKNGKKIDLDKDVKMLFIEDEKMMENKASLGVMISDDGQGVTVDDIIKDSGADKAGLSKGDIILKINDTYIFSMGGLLETLSPYEGGEKIKVTYLRDGKEKTVKAELKAK